MMTWTTQLTWLFVLCHWTAVVPHWTKQSTKCNNTDKPVQSVQYPSNVTSVHWTELTCFLTSAYRNPSNLSNVVVVYLRSREELGIKRVILLLYLIIKSTDIRQIGRLALIWCCMGCRRDYQWCIFKGVAHAA
jgi:hypothetical protein